MERLDHPNTFLGLNFKLYNNMKESEKSWYAFYFSFFKNSGIFGSFEELKKFVNIIFELFSKYSIENCRVMDMFWNFDFGNICCCFWGFEDLSEILEILKYSFRTLRQVLFPNQRWSVQIIFYLSIQEIEFVLLHDIFLIF